MANNKVIYGDTTIMDITDTTAEAGDVAEGKVFYGKDGVRTQGTGSGGGIFVAEKDVTTFSELKEAIHGGKQIWVKDGSTVYTVVNHSASIPDTVHSTLLMCAVSAGQSVISYMYYEILHTDVWTKREGQYTPPTPTIPVATETVSGTIKLNPSEAISKNANGQLQVGGRLGQFPTTTGIYAPNNRNPRNVGNYSFLITDALGVDMNANRSMAVVSGLGITCKSAPAGSTEYRVPNNYANRIQCKMAEGGFASRDEATSTTEQIVQVLSVTIDGASFTPNSAPNDTSKDIVIKTASTLNPSSAITSIRIFGTMKAYATMHAGNGISSQGGGRNLLLGGGVTKYGQSNDNCLVGNGIYSSGNGNACFGRHHIAVKNRGLLSGTGHDTTNAPAEGASALGQYSYMDAKTLFAVGNGSSHTDRKNAFEVRSDGMVIPSPNGTRYKIAVDDSGTISATPV